MNWNKHSELREGEHAFLSPSSNSWLRATDDKLISNRQSKDAKDLGTRLHKHAEECILLGTKLQRCKKTLNMYVNDAILFGLHPEQPLVYSGNCYGTADAIEFDEESLFLRIHDLKTGAIPAKMDQLRIYAAIFCLEYHYDPRDLTYELRIYQNNDIVIENTEPQLIFDIASEICRKDELLKSNGYYW